MDGIKERREEWQSGMAKNITFIVTKDCQLACKYCYLIGKNTKERMSWEIAKAAIDYILDHEEDMKEESVIWDFIGGEPFLEIDLIDKICDYLKVEMYRRNHHWFNSFRFSFSTNGINYSSEKVQKFIKKNRTEIKRLRGHAEEALFRGNKVQYVYAVKKLRDMLKQPYTEDFIDTMWNTSLASIRNIVASQQKH